MSPLRKTFAKKFNATDEQIEGMLNQIGFVESNNENIPQHGGGPGRGYFQFETQKGSGAFQTALNRVTNRYKALGIESPEWVGKARESDNAMNLSRDEQEEVLLADFWYKKGSDPLIKEALETGSAKNLWLQKHWAGAPVGSKDYKKKAGQWDRHMMKYKGKNIAAAALDDIKKNAKSIIGRVFNSESDVDFGKFEATDEMKAAREKALKKRK